MKKRIYLIVGLIIFVAIGVAIQKYGEEPVIDKTPGAPTNPDEEPTETPAIVKPTNYPKISSWLAKKDELLQSGKPYCLVMAGWFTPEEAAQFRENNPDVKLLAGLTTTWVWDNEDWMRFLVTIANYGRDEAIEITEEMYLHDSEGERCAFGWESEEWGHEEIYAMDPRNEDWVNLVANFYETVLAQPTHDGIIVDMVIERQYWGQDAITDEEWTDATKAIYQRISDLNNEDKLVIFNAGARLSDIDDYSEYFDGYLMENFMGDQLKTTFSEGLETVNGDKIVIIAVDTDDTGVVDTKKMRLGLTLSLLGDNTYFTYDFGPRDHGQAWWYPEYDADLGEPLGEYYERDGAYWRAFEKGFVVAAPNGASVTFDEEYVDVTSGETSESFTIEEGDGRIFLLNATTS
ncbi:hypothetical protein E2P65_01190 [Candidatus Bathyarchaeota archaeon]|nr:hypothetical protein E2P65_01190 [Candidatus Bathyarchaeota archaeon]